MDGAEKSKESSAEECEQQIVNIVVDADLVLEER